MVIEEIGKRYEIPLDTLKKYEANELIKGKGTVEGAVDYSDKDLEQLGLIGILIEAGFSMAETRRYLKLAKGTETDEEQIRMLRKQRWELLDSIHKKQQTLDQIDFMIWQKKHKAEEK